MSRHTIVCTVATIGVFLSMRAHAFFELPWITPAAPEAGEVVSASMRMGTCDAVVFLQGYPQITQQGNSIRIVEYGDHVPSEDFCIYPVLTTTVPLGAFPAGDYVLTVDFVYDDYPLGLTTLTLGVVPFSVSRVTSAVSVPTFAAAGRLGLLVTVLCAGLWILRMRRQHRGTAV